MSAIQKGEDFEHRIRAKLVENGIECNKTQASYRDENNKLIIIGDGNIDLFGNYQTMNYIIQCKYKNATKYKVEPKEIREFITTLSKQSSGTIGFFVTNSSYTQRCYNELNNFPKLRIVLCMENTIIHEFQRMKDIILYENENQSYSSVDNLIIDEIELDGCDGNIFGLKVIGGVVKIKNISTSNVRYKPY